MASQTNSWASGNAGTGSQEVANNLLTAVANYVWNTSSLTWVTETQPSGGGGGGGTQYAQGTVNSTPTGTVAMGKTAANVLQSLALDASGNLNVNLAAGSISGGNAAASPTGAAVPASADYLGFNVAGNLVGVSATNPLPVSASVSFTDPAESVVGAATPTSAIQLGWNSGNVTQNVTPTNALPISVNAANFIFSSANSSTTQLAAGATFTGTIETALNQPEISLLMTCDQPVTLTVNQFIDLAGVYAVTPIVFTIAAGVQFSRSFPLNGNYVQVKVQNTGASTTTTFNLNTAYGTIGSSDSAGNTPVSGTISAIQSGTWNIGSITTLPAITGSVSVSNFPATQAVSGTVAATQSGTWNIGSITTLPALPTGANVIGGVTQSGTWNIGSITTLPALATGANTIGAVNIAAAQTLATVTTVGTVSAITAGPAIASGFYSRITDGTNGPAAVKAASTAAAFTDPALVIDNRPGTAMLTASAALADALANPTLGQQAVLPSVFNGTTWDRARGGIGVSTTTGDTGAKTATGNGATQTNVGYKGISLVIAMGAVTGTTPTCVIKMQSSVDGGTNWVDIPGATTASLTATGVWGIDLYPGEAVTAGTTTTGTKATASGILPRTWRVVWTIGGTTPSFTITSITFNYIN